MQVKDHGLAKLGTFQVQDAQLLGALAGRSMLTYGSESPTFDERMWRQELDRLAPKSCQGTHTCEQAYIQFTTQNGVPASRWRPML